MYLYLVRHGQSVGNERKLFFGKSDYPLTELGWEHARQAAEKLKEVFFTRCVASDLKRAWDTALVCVEGRGVTPEPAPALREQDMGGMENLTFEEARARYGELFERMMDDWFHVPPPDGEDAADMAKRVGDCVDDIVRRGEDTLIVAHNGSLSLILRHFNLADENDIVDPKFGWFFQHGTYSAIRVDENEAELVRFNG